MRILKSAAMITFSFLMPILAYAQDWVEYRPAGVGYRIEMPRQWELSTQDVQTQVGSIKLNMAIVDNQSKAYMSIYSVFPADHIARTPVETLLNNARDGAVNNVKGKLRSETRLVMGGKPVRHIVIDAPPARISQRLILVGVTLVQSIYVGSPGDETDADPARFFSSFTLTNP